MKKKLHVNQLKRLIGKLQLNYYDSMYIIINFVFNYKLSQLINEVKMLHKFSYRDHQYSDQYANNFAFAIHLNKK